MEVSGIDVREYDLADPVEVAKLGRDIGLQLVESIVPLTLDIPEEHRWAFFAALLPQPSSTMYAVLGTETSARVLQVMQAVIEGRLAARDGKQH